MNIQPIQLDDTALRKLLLSGSPNAVMLHLYLAAGNPLERAGGELHISENQISCAVAVLRQLGLYTEVKTTFVPGERPAYNEQDVAYAMTGDKDFPILCAEVERLLGKPMNIEEKKILLGFQRYLGLPGEVISILVSWCKERARQKGNIRNPSLRTIEKEAYYWAEQGIDTLEEAAAFIRSRNLRNSRTEKLKTLLQIRGRSRTPGEERYAAAWLDMGFDDEALADAYERTCLNTGGLNWPYMNKILTRWHEAGLHTLDAIKRGDRKAVPQGASGQLGQAEVEAIRRMFKEET